MPDLITLADIQAAALRITPAAVRTPLVRLTRARLVLAGFPDLADTTPDIYLKDESAQPIGSFKLRGAYNKIAQLTPEELRRGVITYSSGNQAQAWSMSSPCSSCGWVSRKSATGAWRRTSIGSKSASRW